jgi:hypothetical protein
MYTMTRLARADYAGFLVVGGAATPVAWNLLFTSEKVGPLSSSVVAWWVFLCAISILNLCGWRLSASALERQQSAVKPTVYQLQRWLLCLSAVYVLGCGFRAALPRADVQRIGMFDSWLSSVLVGRSVATVAELCFVAQWALVLRKNGLDVGSRFAVGVSWALVPLIVVAEMCSWYAVLSTCYLGNVFEESLWALSATLLLAGYVSLWRPSGRMFRAYLAAVLAVGAVYVFFMCTVDIPMYVSRWLADEAQGRHYLTLAQGLDDVWSRRVVTYQWEAWWNEIPWMTLYFSVAVWLSIVLVHVPRWGIPASRQTSV